MGSQLLALARRSPLLRPWADRLAEKRDWTGARNFFLALFWLGISLILVLNGAAAIERGYLKLGATYDIIALLIAAYVSVKLVPAMARGTPLRWLFYQVDYKLTKEGGFYLAATFVIVLAALNTGNNLLFLILASLLAGILVSGIVSRIVLTGIDLKLELPEHVFARRPVLASLTLENLKLTLPSFSLTVGELSANGRKKATKKSHKEKGAAEASPADGGPRRVLREPVYFPYIPRARDATQHVELVFPRRGRYRQDVFPVSSKFPFGFLLKTRSLAAASDIVVYPRIEPTEEFYDILPLISGELESYQRGRGHDLYTIRDHQPGDSARYVDWKASAKARELKVREFAREDERRIELVFDSILPAPPTAAPAAHRTSALAAAFERAVDFTACLAWHFHEMNAQMLFRSPDWDSPAAPAGEIIYDILHHLALVEPTWQADNRFLESLDQGVDSFKIVITSRPRGSLPTGLWASSYFVFMQTLGKEAA